MDRPTTEVPVMRLPIAALALAAAACGTSEHALTADEARRVLPRAEAAQLGTPTDTAQAVRAGAAAQAVAGAPAVLDPAFTSTSEYARTTYFTAWTVNGGVWWTLTLVRTIALYPPTACADDTCTWGPWDDTAAGTQTVIKRWRLVVKKVSDGQYAYALSAQNAVTGGGWLDILTGTAYPGAGGGHGEFTLSFDNARQLPDPKDDHGVLTVHYDAAASTVQATFVGARDAATGTLMNAAYDFASSGAGGSLSIALERREGAPSAISLHSRWDATGAGRGDAQGHATDGSWSVTYGASECWDGAFALTWDTDPAFGDPTACPAAFQGEPQYAQLAVP